MQGQRTWPRVKATPPLQQQQPAQQSCPPNLHRMQTGRGSEPSISESEREKPISQDTEEDTFGFLLDPAGDLTYDVTTVDVVTVPCPGGHRLRTWNRDGLLGRYFGAPSMRDAEGSTNETPTSSWVRQGIRREANRSRILLYQHPPITPDTTLNELATQLLESLDALRKQEGQQRPLVFLGHSIGGLVVKMALVKANRNLRYEPILRECYGVGFFGTPHQGSSYLAMSSLSKSIQTLLQLSAPLPEPITCELRVGSPLLTHIDEDFKELSSDLRVWTFYETIDSRLSGGSQDGGRDVFFTAPLTSVKSAILGMRQERIFPLQSDHANVASFGKHNVSTMQMFLRQLSTQIDKADAGLASTFQRTSLNLDQKVHVEIHGFFDDAVDREAAVRAWSTRLPLGEFLNKGPEGCLSERLSEIDGTPEESRFLRARGRTSIASVAAGSVSATPPGVMTVKDALGIRRASASPPMSPIIRPMDAQLTTTASMVSRASPLVRAELEQDMVVDRLSPPLQARRVGRSLTRSVSVGSDEFTYRDFPRFSPRSKTGIDSAMDDEAIEDLDDIDASPRLPESVVVFKNASKPREIFIKPHIKTRKFVWIHLPYNNPSWVKSILQTLQTSQGRDLSMLYGHDFWATKHTRGRHAQHYAYFAKPGCYFSGPRPFSPRNSLTSPSMSPHAREGNFFTTTFFPYLHFDSYKRLIRRRDLIVQRLRQGRARPIPESVSKSESLEMQVIWEYLGNDPPVNCRRTLDQFGYPSLRDTRSRDDDQMLYKLTKERGCAPGKIDLSNQTSGDDGTTWREKLIGRTRRADEAGEEDVLNGNVLMVDQLWLWAINDTLLTCFPRREGDVTEGPLYQQADLRDSIFNEVNVDLSRQCENALDLAALAVLHASTVLLDRAAHPDLEVFRIFEEAISVLTERLTSSLKEFREEGVRDKAFDFDAMENKTGSIRERHREEGRRAERENRDNTSALLELRDIEDELVILLHLFEKQSKVISAMHSVYSRTELREQTINGRIFLADAQKKVTEYIHQAEEMIRRVRNTRDDYDKLLQMVQRQAQVDEVRLSRLHADVASAQSRSVLIFTTFTVIFLPLTFFTGLFGMNTQEWGGEHNLSLKTIGSISIPASAFLIIASLVVAWSTRVRRVLKWLAFVCEQLERLAYLLLWRPLMRQLGMRKRRKVQEAESAVSSGIVTEVSDFWERHQLERNRGYKIPDVNRKGIKRKNYKETRKDI